MTVTRLTAQIKSLLEKQFNFIWVTGEISNLARPVSGHVYFTLKDARAQISAVLFRGQSRLLKFDPQNGMSVTGFGRLGVYEPRGTYQIIFEHLEPKGLGALQAAFEQLKAKLANEGLFDAQYKRQIPYLPHRISIVTSRSGAVLHDMLNIIQRRFSNLHICILPVMVQGTGASEDIVRAIEVLNRQMDSDVIVLARGGGSLEDLQAFNTESVARAIFASQIPVVSAIGHETDYTISDFVADLRAPTPSAAAELIVPEKAYLKLKLSEIESNLTSIIYRYLDHRRMRIDDLAARLLTPEKRLAAFRHQVDDMAQRMKRALLQMTQRQKERLNWRIESIKSNNPNSYIQKNKEKVENLIYKLLLLNKFNIDKNRSAMHSLTARLTVLNPRAILDRGYSITRTLPEKHVVSNVNSVSLNEKIEVLLSKGSLACRIEDKN